MLTRIAHLDMCDCVQMHQDMPDKFEILQLSAR
jgi:hypothetical protein